MCVCECACVCVCLLVRILPCSAAHVEVDGGEVMSDIDLLNTAPSHRNDDVIQRKIEKEGERGGGGRGSQKKYGMYKTFNDLGNKPELKISGSKPDQ